MFPKPVEKKKFFEFTVKHDGIKVMICMIWKSVNIVYIFSNIENEELVIWTNF
jgi:hypothetical protein